MSLPSGYRLRPFILADYDQVIALWKTTEGMGLGESDTRPAIAAFLKRNPGLSRVIESDEGRIAGAIMCGHDGRRGYLHHLAVPRTLRNKGFGGALVDACLADLKSLSIPKCNLFLFADNLPGRDFWQHEGWTMREDLIVVQKSLGKQPTCGRSC
ncbi:MAG: GNAT family N-acetyltransferase [Opitutaceae bacterium]|jgi:putative acetyltransferase